VGQHREVPHPRARPRRQVVRRDRLYTSKVIDALAWSLETALEAMRTATPKDDARSGLPSEPPRSEGRPADRQGPVPPLYPVVLPTGWHVACTGVVLREVSRTGRASD
jgi:hypothetical protein